MTLRKARDLYPDKVAVVDGDRSLTYARMGERVNALARFFQARDINPQDRISILEVNSLAFLETYYAAAGIGAILNPLELSPGSKRNCIHFKRFRLPLAGGRIPFRFPGKRNS